MLGNKLLLIGQGFNKHIYSIGKRITTLAGWGQDLWCTFKGDSEENAIIEDYYLFGKAVPEKEGFSLLNDGKKNEIQLVPLKLNKSESVVLKVCHMYLMLMMMVNAISIKAD